MRTLGCMRLRTVLCVVIVSFSVATPVARPFAGPKIESGRELRGAAVLVEFRSSSREARRVLHAAHAHLVSAQLALWRVPRASAGATLRRLNRAGLLLGAERERFGIPSEGPLFDDPLYSTEWWRADVGADAVTPPHAGVPITVLDSGVDFTHPEFAHRADTTALNTQSLTDTSEDFHGSAVASVAAAPANGVGIVGLYPTAKLRSWDARQLSNADVIAGILAAAKRGPTVINLSLGYPQPDPMIEQAVLVAFGEGSIVVASAGNDFANGNPLIYPASLPHVLTVAATDESNRPTDFSSSSEAVDLSAPGQHIVAALPLSYDPNGWQSVDGTSFSAPIVSAATAWVWTARPQLDNTQVFDLMRWSARDIWRSGFDPDTGFGLLDLPAALTATPPPVDPDEPNDDVYEIKAHGLFREATAPLTHGSHGAARITARLDVTEDPVDVYRVWIPARKSMRAKAIGTDDVDVAMWRASTTSIAETGTSMQRDLLASSEQAGTDMVTVRNAARRGEWVYLEVMLGAQAPAARYTLGLSTLSVKP